MAAGHVTFRLPVDWARAEPADGSYDEAVFEEYVSVCEAGRAQGVKPVLVLQDGELPAWLGHDFWLRLDSPARFGAWAAATADRLGACCDDVLTFFEPNALAWQAWITGAHPPHRVIAVGDLVRSLDHVLAAHVAAHAEVHRRRPGAVVSLELRAEPFYEIDGLLHDVLTARDRGVGRYDLRPWLTECRRDWYQKRRPPTFAGSIVRRLVESAIPLDQALPRAIAAVYEGAHERPIDRYAGPVGVPR